MWNMIGQRDYMFIKLHHLLLEVGLILRWYFFSYDTTSKFERFIAYATYMIPSHYSIKAAIFSDTIEIDGNVMPISIMTEYTVSVRPCRIK